MPGGAARRPGRSRCGSGSCSTWPGAWPTGGARPGKRWPRWLSSRADDPLPVVADAGRQRRTAGAVAGAGPVRRGRAHPVRRPATRRDGRRHRPRRRRRAALGRAHQALHDHRHRARPGQDLRRHRLRDHRRAARACRSRRPAPPRSGLRTRRWPSPRWPAATAGGCSTRSGSPRLHDWHVEAGAVFEDVGQWKRPRFYPQPGEDMDAAVLRECAAARTGVGILDGSTLGKIDVQGPDAARSARPALHEPDEQPEGRLGPLRRDVRGRRDGHRRRHGAAPGRRPLPRPDHHRRRGARSSTGWRSGCRPSGRSCGCTAPRSPSSGSTFPVVGPRSRDVIGAVFPDVDVSQGGVPVHDLAGHHAGRRADPAGPDQLLRRARLRGLRQPLVRGGGLAAARSRPAAPYGITPYGTETMHVLRAEKGYPIIGQDTDGTVTPQDLGMAWAVSKKKPDFVGKRSFARAANQDPLRKQLVGLLPVDRQTVLPEGSQIVEFCADGQLPPPPVPMLGHVTSSYRSAELGRPFALALVKGGRSRVGEHRPRPRARHPRPGRGHRLGAGRSRKEPVAMAESTSGCCAPTRSRRGATAFAALPRRRSASPPSRSSRWSTSGSASTPAASGWGSTCRRVPTPGCRPTPGAPSGSGPTSGC